MAAHKGHKKAGGRQKGTPNKTTAEVKAALVQAFGELGGTDSLVKWARGNPTEFYKLWGKMLPQELKAQVTAAPEVKWTIQVVDDADAPAPEAA